MAVARAAELAAEPAMVELAVARAAESAVVELAAAWVVARVVDLVVELVVAASCLTLGRLTAGSPTPRAILIRPQSRSATS